MSAYLIANIEVTDAAAYEAYRIQVTAVVAAYGGRYLARGGQVARLEGEISPQRVVILEFPTMARLKAFYDCPEYRPLIAIRQRAARSHLFAVEGL